MILLIIYALVSIVFSFLCSIWEAVLLSITPSYITRKQEESPALGKQLKEFKDDIDRPLSAILTLNTIAHTVGAILVGAQASTIYGDNHIDALGIHFSYEGIVAGLMTLAILILSEIIPKTLGANFWRRLAPITVKSLKVIMFILSPLIWVTMLITKMLKSKEVESVFSRADYKAMTNLGEQSGVLEKEETAIIRNLLDLEKVHIEDIMTPRSVVFMMNENAQMKDFYEIKEGFHHSRIPLFKDTRDNITGFVLKDEIFDKIIGGKGNDQMKTIVRPITFVSEDANLNEFFKLMADSSEQIAMVTDRYGTMNGLVTLEDVMETILGYEIVDETDKYADLQEYAKKKWADRIDKISQKKKESN